MIRKRGRKRWKTRRYTPGMFRARETAPRAEDFPTEEAGFAHAAKSLNATHWVHGKGPDSYYLYVPLRTGYFTRHILYKTRGLFHFDKTSKTENVAKLPREAIELKSYLAVYYPGGKIAEEGGDDWAKNECVVHGRGDCSCPPRTRVPVGTTEEDLRLANDLVLYAENTGDLYEDKKDIYRELRNLQVTNRYNDDTAWKVWLRWVKLAAGMYIDDVAPKRFTPRAMEIAAKTIAERYAMPLWRGEYDEIIWKPTPGSMANEHVVDNPRGPRCGPDRETGKWKHRGGCCPGRPTCRMQRREAGLCHCAAYHYPHREGAGRCGDAEQMDKHIYGPRRDAGEAFDEAVMLTADERELLTAVAAHPGTLPRSKPFVLGGLQQRGLVRWHRAKLEITDAGRAVLQSEAREAGEDASPVAHSAAEQSAPSGEANAVPWVKIERDPKQYEAQIASAQAHGKIDSAGAVYSMLAPSLAKEDQETFLVVGVDVRGQCRGVVLVHKGARSRVSVDVPEILRTANALGGEMFIVVHNHPTTNATPSAADRSLTKAIEKAAKASEQVMMDHVVIGMGEYFSFAENKLTKVASGARRETKAKPTRAAPPTASEEPVAGGYVEHAFLVAPRYLPHWLLSYPSWSGPPGSDWRLVEVEYPSGPEPWDAIGFSSKAADVYRILDQMHTPRDAAKWYAKGAPSTPFGKHTRSWLDLFTPLYKGSPIWWFGHGGKPERPAALIDFHKFKQGSSLGKKKGSFYAMSYADFESGNWPKEIEKLGAWEGDGARETSLPGGEPDIEFIVAPMGPIPAWLTMSNRSSARPDRVATRIRLEDLEEIFREDGSDAVTISTPESRAIWFSNVLTDENPEILALAVYSGALKWFQRGERFVHYGKGANKYGTWAGMKLRKKETIRDLLQAITIVEQDTYSTVWLYDLEKMKPERVLTMWELIQPFGPAGSTPEPHWTTNSYERDGGISFRDEKGKTLWPLSERQWEEGEWPPESEGGPPAAKYGMEPTG